MLSSRAAVLAALALSLAARSAESVALRKTTLHLQNATEGNATAGNSPYMPTMQYEGYEEDWQTEWKRHEQFKGEKIESYPHWKDTVTKAWMDNSYNRYDPRDYVDSQSDGKKSPAPY
eukprot:TRINITY_DN5185_c0_g1_i1.p2 TRINITY_DN5185_c0_g1~~TRINITY_DN5185_c0_g1_i1.p2  ORF type:complete len:118 (-),score=30.39 TRINITY_DN5185_c0_g1_i1:136-489(-)